MSNEKILTKHPQKKKGWNIDKTKFNVIKKSIVDCLKNKELRFTQLTQQISKKLKGKFQGSFPWYVEVVKLDLEARKIIERVPKTKPQLYRLK